MTLENVDHAPLTGGPEQLPSHQWFRWSGTCDNLVVRQGEPSDLAAIVRVLAESSPPVSRDSVAVGRERRTVWPVTWLVVERPRRVVGAARLVGVDPGGCSNQLYESRRWGDQRQVREAREIILSEIDRDVSGELTPLIASWRPPPSRTGSTGRRC